MSSKGVSEIATNSFSDTFFQLINCNSYKLNQFHNNHIWKIAKKLAINPARRAILELTGHGRLPLTWCKGNNWGDALSPIMVSLLSGKQVMHVNGLHHHRHLAIGSILGGANERAEVWGSGFIRENELLVGRPRKVHAVRGPLTREALLRQGVECPEIYGDPALLLPRFFNPKIEKKYAVGIVPHYVDKDNSWIRKQQDDPQVKVIDIEGGIQEFVRDVKSCELILSSSLHGLICADAYEIPNAWVRFSDNVIGGDFKFRDYRLSIGAAEPKCFRVGIDSKLTDAVAQAERGTLQIDMRRLLFACPFLSDSLHQEVLDCKATSCGLPEELHSTRINIVSKGRIEN